MGEAQLQSVKEYIAKHNLEDELSNAVNQAIKLDSDDPYRVISDYLRKFAKEQDEEEDDDDDVIPEGEEPVHRPTGRRQQVVAAKLEIPDGWTPPTYEKTASESEFLETTMAGNKLMKSLAPSDRKQLMMAFKKIEFAPGDTIIKQGDAGDLFYILDSGVADISISGKGSVMKATKGIAFGELALLHNAPRAATVTAEEPVVAWGLDAISFKSILMGKSQTDAEDYKNFIKQVPILKDLSPESVQEMASALKEGVFMPQQNIICEGDEGNDFYIIREGEVKCTKAGEGEVSRKLTRGDFFGELALLSSDKRAATVTATKPTTVLSLKRDEFTRLLGPLKDLISETAAASRS